MKKRKSRLRLLSNMLVRSKLFSTEVGEGRGWVRLSRRSEDGFHALMSVAMRYRFSWLSPGSILRVNSVP